MGLAHKGQCGGLACKRPPPRPTAASTGLATPRLAPPAPRTRMLPESLALFSPTPMCTRLQGGEAGGIGRLERGGARWSGCKAPSSASCPAPDQHTRSACCRRCGCGGHQPRAATLGGGRTRLPAGPGGRRAAVASGRRLNRAAPAETSHSQARRRRSGSSSPPSRPAWRGGGGAGGRRGVAGATVGSPRPRTPSRAILPKLTW